MKANAPEAVFHEMLHGVSLPQAFFKKLISHPQLET